MLIVRLAGDHLYGKLLLTWLSLVMCLIVPFSAVFFRDISWMGSGIRFDRCLRVFLPTFA